MNKYLIFSLLSLCVAGTVKAMQKPVSQHAQVPTVEAHEECLICIDEAGLVAKEKGLPSIRKTTCCNKFLCENCCTEQFLKGINICPNCQATAQFDTVNATIKNQEDATQNTAITAIKEFDILEGLSEEEKEALFLEQLKLEAEIEEQNLKSQREAQEHEQIKRITEGLNTSGVFEDGVIPGAIAIPVPLK